nr:MAG TPA: hypothetical protein [Caudoviricetes sp.]
MPSAKRLATTGQLPDIAPFQIKHSPTFSTFSRTLSASVLRCRSATFYPL